MLVSPRITNSAWQTSVNDLFFLFTFHVSIFLCGMHVCMYVSRLMYLCGYTCMYLPVRVEAQGWLEESILLPPCSLRQSQSNTDLNSMASLPSQLDLGFLVGLEVQLGMSLSPGIYVGYRKSELLSLLLSPLLNPYLTFLIWPLEVLAKFPAHILSLVVSSNIVRKAEDHWQSVAA